MSESVLYTAQDGPEDAPVWIVLADKYHMLDDVRAFGAAVLPSATRRVSVRGSRVQTIGGSGVPHGCYWHIGTLETPELSTFGDALFQLEIILNETVERYGGPVRLLGSGQGAGLALTLALVWPDKVTEVLAIGAGFPRSLHDMPLELGRADALSVTLREVDAGVVQSALKLSEAVGVKVTHDEADLQPG